MEKETPPFQTPKGSNVNSPGSQPGEWGKGEWKMENVEPTPPEFVKGRVECQVLQTFDLSEVTPNSHFSHFSHSSHSSRFSRFSHLSEVEGRVKCQVLQTFDLSEVSPNSHSSRFSHLSHSSHSSHLSRFSILSTL
jgi:hypothetical protein